MSLASNLDNVLAPAVTAVVGGISSKILYPGMSMEVLGVDLDAGLFLGALAGGASFVNSTVENQIILRTGYDKTALGSAQMLFSPMVTGGVMVAGSFVLNGFNTSRPSDYITLFLLGAISEVVGSYTADAVLKPLLVKSSVKLY